MSKCSKYYIENNLLVRLLNKMPITQSYTPNYFAIDDILASQERVPTKFIVNLPNLGHLNPASEDEDLAAGTLLDLPFWLVQQLAGGRQAIVSLDLPKIYTEPYREILKADASAVDLHKFNLFFYEFGQYIKSIDSRGDVHDIIIETFINRFRKVMDLADNSLNDPTITNELDMLERKLFECGHQARIKLNQWLIETGMQIETSSLVANYKKRKRIDFDEK